MKHRKGENWGSRWSPEWSSVSAIATGSRSKLRNTKLIHVWLRISHPVWRLASTLPAGPLTRLLTLPLDPKCWDMVSTCQPPLHILVPICSVWDDHAPRRSLAAVACRRAALGSICRPQPAPDAGQMIGTCRATRATHGGQDAARK